MAQAPAQDQRELLKVADLDQQIARLDRDNAKHPLRNELGVLMNAAAARGRDLDEAQNELEAAQSELVSREAASAKIQEEIADKDVKLNAGTGLTSRDLLVLQEEIAGLRERLNAAQDAEFAGLEAVELAEEKISETRASIAALKDTILSGRAKLEDEVTEILAKKEELQAKRDAIAELLSSDLMRVYTRARERGGYCVIAMRSNGTTDQGMAISPVEVAQIKALPDDEIYVSEDYDCIIVRL